MKKIYHWNVSNVCDMWDMFNVAESFNQPLHAPWYQDGMHEESESEWVIEQGGNSNMLNT